MNFIDEIMAFRDKQTPKAGTAPRVPMQVRSLMDAVTEEDTEGLQLEVNFQTIGYEQNVFQAQSRAYGRTNFYFGTDDAGYNEDVLVLQLSGTSGDIRRHLKPVNRASESAPLPPDYEEAANAAAARLSSIYRLSRLTRQPKFFVPELVSGGEGGEPRKFLGHHRVYPYKRTFNWVHLLITTPLVTPRASVGAKNDGDDDASSIVSAEKYIPLRGFFSQPLLLQEQAQQVGFVNFTTQFTVLHAPERWFFGRYNSGKDAAGVFATAVASTSLADPSFDAPRDLLGGLR